jgi:hypothetical protein
MFGARSRPSFPKPLEEAGLEQHGGVLDYKTIDKTVTQPPKTGPSRM